MLNDLHENIGDKIKGAAKITFIIEAIGAIGAGLAMCAEDEDLIPYGLLVIVCGSIVAWVSSWILYAFGQLVEDTHETKKQAMKLSNIDKNLQIIAQPIAKEMEEQEKRKAEEAAKRKAEAARETEKTVVPVERKNPDAPYWCCKCGHDGPYEGNCPKCGSTSKVFNVKN